MCYHESSRSRPTLCYPYVDKEANENEARGIIDRSWRTGIIVASERRRINRAAQCFAIDSKRGQGEKILIPAESDVISCLGRETEEKEGGFCSLENEFFWREKKLERERTETSRVD